MARTLVRLTDVDPGFRPGHLLTLRLVLPAGYDAAAKRAALATELTARTRALPGVVNAGVSLSLPIDGSNWNSSMSARDRPMPHTQLPQAAMIPVDDAFLQTMGAHLLHGRSVDPASIRSAVEGVVSTLSRDMPVSLVRTMEGVMAAATSRQRMALIVLGVFAVVALVLAAAGLYGLVAHSVTERTHEIGVRMALGAARTDVVGMIARQGLSMTMIGIAVGVAGAAALSNSLRGLVFGIETIDPLTFSSVPVLLVAVSLIACYVPAWRAARIAPVTALRRE